MTNDEEYKESCFLCECQFAADASNGFGFFSGGSWDSSVMM